MSSSVSTQHATFLHRSNSSSLRVCCCCMAQWSNCWTLWSAWNNTNAHSVSYLVLQVSPINHMNPFVIISKFYHCLLAEINWLLIFSQTPTPSQLSSSLPYPSQSPQFSNCKV